MRILRVLNLLNYIYIYIDISSIYTYIYPIYNYIREMKKKKKEIRMYGKHYL